MRPILSKLASKIPLVVYPLCHVGRVGCYMLVTTMTHWHSGQDLELCDSETEVLEVGHTQTGQGELPGEDAESHVSDPSQQCPDPCWRGGGQQLGFPHPGGSCHCHAGWRLTPEEPGHCWHWKLFNWLGLSLAPPLLSQFLVILEEGRFIGNGQT